MLLSKWLKPIAFIKLATTILVVANPLVPQIQRPTTTTTLDTLVNALPTSQPNDNPSLIPRSNLSPDILATSVPVVAVSSHNERISSDVLNKDLLLRSSTHNISGLRGYSLFALPILASELSEILQTAQGDLQSRDGRASTLFYTVKTTNWTFSVVAAANTTSPVRYASIEAVIQRFVKLSSVAQAPSPAPDAIVSTRVGVLFNGSSPVADINISPCRALKHSSPFVPFAGLDHHQNFSSSTPEEIVKITPYGSSCAYEIVDEKNALASFQRENDHDHDDDGGPKEQVGKVKKKGRRQLESEVLAHIGHAAFASTVNIWRRDDGMPVEVKLWALKAIIHVAYWQFVASSLLFALDLSMSGNDDLALGFFESSVGLDTGVYVLGRLAARFVVTLVHTAGGLGPGGFTVDDWQAVFGMFLKPLREMVETDNGWAMDGVIFQPGGGGGRKGNASDNGESDFRMKSQDEAIVARWQIWMGDFEEYDR